MVRFLRVARAPASSTAGCNSQSNPVEFHGIGELSHIFLWRIAVLAFVFILEGLLIFVHVRDYYRDSIARMALAFASFFVIFGYPRVRYRIRLISGTLAFSPVSWRFSVLHVCAMAVFLAAASPSLVNRVSGAHELILLAVWLSAGVSAIIFAGIAVIPAPLWLDLLRGTGRLCIYAFAAAGVVWGLAPYLWNAWDDAGWKFGEDLTFWLVSQLLRPLLSAVVADPATHAIGSDRFSVTIEGACSGWEGLGLMVVFSILWLWLSRRECRFPQAFILVPGAMVLIFLLNAVRIAVLILIGHAVSPRVAISGFHSQAGWIAFNMVAFGIALIAPRIPWLNRREALRILPDTALNPTIPYLLPFAAILASGMLSRAASAGFEWLYPLRLLAAAGAIWVCRRKYRELNWRPDWLSPVAGGAVFLVWLALDSGAHRDSGIAAGLADLSMPARFAWLVSRCTAAVITVPPCRRTCFSRLSFSPLDFFRF